MNADLTRTPPNGRYADINGMQLYYAVHGEGPPLLLLHGFTQSGQQWQAYVDAFAACYRVIVPDLRGHGRSVDPTNRLTFRQAALDCYDLLEQLGIDRCAAIGDSGGACVLQYMASQHPSLFDAVILVEGGSYFPAQLRTAMLASTTVDDADLTAAGTMHRHGASQLRALLEQLPAILDDYAAHPPDLTAIQARTLVVFGDRDQFYPLSVPVEMVATLPHGSLWILPDTSHAFLIAQPARYADRFIEMALAFLAGDSQ